MLELIDMLANSACQRETHLLSPTLNSMTKPLQQRKTGTATPRKRKAKKCTETEIAITNQDISPVIGNYAPHNVYNATYPSPAPYSTHNTYTTSSSHHQTMTYCNNSTPSPAHHLLSNDALGFYHEPLPIPEQFQRRLNDPTAATTVSSKFLSTQS